MKEKFKNLEKKYRELGIEGDDVFTLIASEYVRFHKLSLSKRLRNLVDNADSIDCKDSHQKVEMLAKAVVKYDPLGENLPSLYQFFHSKRFRDNTGKFFTPQNITKSMVDMLPFKNDAVIFDPTCGGGSFLLDASKRWKNNSCHLIANDIDNYLVTLTEIILKIQIPTNHNLSFFSENIYSPVETIQLFKNRVDYILANPPFSLNIENFNSKSKLFKNGYRKSDALFIDLAKDLLKEGGRLVCLLPHSIISNKEYTNLRKIVEEDWHLNAVIVLPEGIFHETANTTVRADILVLKKKGIGVSNSKTVFCNVSSIGEPLNSRDSLFDHNDLGDILKKHEVQEVLEMRSC